MLAAFSNAGDGELMNVDLNNGTFVRYRYKSEVDNKNTSYLPLKIKNLEEYIGSIMKLCLFKWLSDEIHPSVHFYQIKTKDNFQFCSDESIEVLITEKELSLDSFGIRKDKKIKGNEANNCRIQMTINDYTEISNVIRHLDPKLTDLINLQCISFPLQSEGNEKIFTIHLTKEVAYFPYEFQLHHGKEIIKAENVSSSECSFRSLPFNLENAKNKIGTSFVLRCITFKKELTITTDDKIMKAYPELSIEEGNGKDYPMNNGPEYMETDCDYDAMSVFSNITSTARDIPKNAILQIPEEVESLRSSEGPFPLDKDRIYTIRERVQLKRRISEIPNVNLIQGNSHKCRRAQKDHCKNNNKIEKNRVNLNRAEETFGESSSQVDNENSRMMNEDLKEAIPVDVHQFLIEREVDFVSEYTYLMANKEQLM